MSPWMSFKADMPVAEYRVVRFASTVNESDAWTWAPPSIVTRALSVNRFAALPKSEVATDVSEPRVSANMSIVVALIWPATKTSARRVPETSTLVWRSSRSPRSAIASKETEPSESTRTPAATRIDSDRTVSPPVVARLPTNRMASSPLPPSKSRVAANRWVT